MGALRRGEIQTNNKLWMSYGDLFVKLPRKNLVSIIEGEQAILVKQIDKCRNEMKTKTAQLLKMQPELTDMDPYVVKLLLQQSEINQKKNQENQEDSEDDDEEELDLE